MTPSLSQSLGNGSAPTRSTGFVASTPHNVRQIHAFGDQMNLLLGAKDTGGRFSMWTNITAPGGGPPPHYHENEDEWFWPLSGSVEFLLDSEWKRFPAGTAIYAPRNSVHTFRNPNEEPLEMLIQTVPGGFEQFFAECEKEFDRVNSVNMEAIIQISSRYGIHYV